MKIQDLQKIFADLIADERYIGETIEFNGASYSVHDIHNNLKNNTEIGEQLQTAIYGLALELMDKHNPPIASLDSASKVQNTKNYEQLQPHIFRCSITGFIYSPIREVQNESIQLQCVSDTNKYAVTCIRVQDIKWDSDMDIEIHQKQHRPKLN